jgi:hypothetical protein
MKIGLNLSFAVKRWLVPELLAAMIRNDFRTTHVQFTWDLVDPWWPPHERDAIARRWSQAFQREGLVLGGTFGGSLRTPVHSSWRRRPSSAGCRSSSSSGPSIGHW